MEQRRLGESGPDVPVICFGAWPIGGGMGSVADSDAIRTVQRAVDLGINFIDTAEAYRTSQDLIGRALDGRRSNVILATKVSNGDLSRQHILSAVDDSLRALRTDYIDLYQAHSWDADHPIDESMRAFDDLVTSGKVRYIGVSNFTVPQMKEALAVRRFSSLQPRFSLLFPEAGEEILPFCLEHGIGVIVHSPLAKGMLAGKYTAETRFPPEDERSEMPAFQGERFQRYLATVSRLEGFAQDHGRTLVELAIAWTLANPAVTSCIVGTKNPAQLDAHVRAADWKLTQADMEEIASLVAE